LQFADFDRLQRDLRSNMRSLESSLNESASLRPGHADQKARLAEAERRLDTELRPFTAQLKSRAEAIQRLLPSDAALRSDLDDRLEGTKRTMEELGLKLASVKRAAQVRMKMGLGESFAKKKVEIQAPLLLHFFAFFLFPSSLLHSTNH